MKPFGEYDDWYSPRLTLNKSLFIGYVLLGLGGLAFFGCGLINLWISGQRDGYRKEIFVIDSLWKEGRCWYARGVVAQKHEAYRVWHLEDRYDRFDDLRARLTPGSSLPILYNSRMSHGESFGYYLRVMPRSLSDGSNPFDRFRNRAWAQLPVGIAYLGSLVVVLAIPGIRRRVLYPIFTRRP